FDVIRSLKKQGISIVYISHRMEEIFELCDRISVLRDGTYIGTKNIPETNMNEIVKMMIGREIGERYPVRNCKIGDTVLKVKDLTSSGDRKSTRLNSSHVSISYAVFCLKQKNKNFVTSQPF